MKKKLVVAIIMAMAMLNTNVITYADTNTSVASATYSIAINVDGKFLNLTKETGEVRLEDSRVFVPIRVVSENLGAEVDWDNTKKSFTITKDGNVIKGFANKSTVTVNGVSKLIDNSPNVVVKQVGSRLYVPIRFVSENLNCDVEYKNRIVYITTGGTIIPVPTPTIGKLDKKYSDFNNPEQAIKYIADTMPGWDFVGRTQYDDTVQAQSANHANVMVSNDDNYVAEIVIRGWNRKDDHKLEKDKQNTQIDMDETKELLKFYFGDKEGQEVYDVVDTCINRGSGFTGKAENGMTVKLTGKSAGFVITIK